LDTEIDNWELILGAEAISGHDRQELESHRLRQFLNHGREERLAAASLTPAFSPKQDSRRLLR